MLKEVFRDSFILREFGFEWHTQFSEGSNRPMSGRTERKV